MAAEGQRLPARLSREGAGAGKGDGHRTGCRQAARAAARRADGAQGHVLPQGRGLDRRQPDPWRLGGASDGDGAGQARRGGRGGTRLPQHGGIRRGSHGPQRPPRSLPQSVGPDARHRRQFERLGRLGGRAHGLWRAGLRYRRFDPPARRGVRRGRHEGNLRARQSRRRSCPFVEPRPCRPADPHRARQCPNARRHRRPRSRRFDHQREAGARLRGAARRRRCGPAHRAGSSERRAGAARSPDRRSHPGRGRHARPARRKGLRRHPARLHRALSRRRSDGEVRSRRHAPALDGENAGALRQPGAHSHGSGLLHPGDAVHRRAAPAGPFREGVPVDGDGRRRCRAATGDSLPASDHRGDRYREQGRTGGAEDGGGLHRPHAPVQHARRAGALGALRLRHERRTDRPAARRPAV